MKVEIKGRPLTLTRADFVGAGGQAEVYARGDTAYKVFTDAAGIIPASKHTELRRLSSPPFMTPIDTIEVGGRHAGHTMGYLPNATPLAAVFSRAFRTRHGISPQKILDWVGQTRAAISAAHRAGVCLVDLNPMNVLLCAQLDRVFFIDVDSYQTPGHPATAIQDSVRDRHSPPGEFNQGTDWFSFAVLAFQTIVGIHPFKGKHPQVKGMDARMVAGISALDPSVSIPKVCFDFDNIPRDWRAWFEAVFHAHHRGAPPKSISHVRSVPASALTSSGKALKIVELADLGAPISAFAAGDGFWVATAGDQVWLDGRPVGKLSTGQNAIVMSSGRRRAAVASLVGDRVHLYDVQRREPINFDIKAQEIRGHEGQALVRSGASILEIALHPMGTRLLGTTRLRANVMPKATRLFDGIAVQSLLGGTWLTLFDESGNSHPLRVAELDGLRVLAARFSSKRAVLLTERGGVFDRVTIDIDLAGQRHTVTVESDVPPHEQPFVELPSGVQVKVLGEGKMSLTRGAQCRELTDPGICAEMTLFRDGHRLIAAHGGRLHTLQMV